MKRQNYLRPGFGSYYPEERRPACYYEVQLRRCDLMLKVGRQRVSIRKSPARGVEIDQREHA